MKTIALRIEPAALEKLHAAMAITGFPHFTDEQIADLAFSARLCEMQKIYGASWAKSERRRASNSTRTARAGGQQSAAFRSRGVVLRGGWECGRIG